jgi:hypothetical protein
MAVRIYFLARNDMKASFVGQAKQCMEFGFRRWDAKGADDHMSLEKGRAHAFVVGRLAQGTRTRPHGLTLRRRVDSLHVGYYRTSHPG